MILNKYNELIAEEKKMDKWFDNFSSSPKAESNLKEYRSHLSKINETILEYEMFYGQPIGKHQILNGFSQDQIRLHEEMMK